MSWSVRVVEPGHQAILATLRATQLKLVGRWQSRYGASGRTGEGVSIDVVHGVRTRRARDEVTKRGLPMNGCIRIDVLPHGPAGLGPLQHFPEPFGVKDKAPKPFVVLVMAHKEPQLVLERVTKGDMGNIVHESQNLRSNGVRPKTLNTHDRFDA